MNQLQVTSRPLLPILSVAFVGSLGFSIVLPFLVFLVTRLGGNALIYGAVGATYSAFQLVGAPAGDQPPHARLRRLVQGARGSGLKPLSSTPTLYNGSSIVGAAFYDPASNLFGAAYTGDHFFADYVNGWIYRTDSDGWDTAYAFARI